MNTAYDSILFDLDGTLVDSRLDLAASVNEALASVGAEPLAHETVFGFIGRGARTLITRSLAAAGADAALYDDMLAAFKSVYDQHLLDTTRPYPGVEETLAALAHKQMAVVTNKPVAFARAMLAGLRLAKYFPVIVGGGPVRELKPAPEPLLHALGELGTDLKHALLVGDSVVDIETARAARMRVCAALYGFEEEEALRAQSPDHVIARFPDLLTVRGVS
jgi:phosphoglycolate phosphatase